jgi:hypothetical protein
LLQLPPLLYRPAKIAGPGRAGRLRIKIAAGALLGLLHLGGPAFRFLPAGILLPGLPSAASGFSGRFLSENCFRQHE